jgi:S1-C subfamily serine protease
MKSKNKPKLEKKKISIQRAQYFEDFHKRADKFHEKVFKIAGVVTAFLIFFSTFFYISDTIKNILSDAKIKASTAITNLFSENRISTKTSTEENELSNVETCNLKNIEKEIEKCTVLIETDIGRGTGIVYKDGYIITNRHVIESTKYIKIVDNNLKTTNAKLWNFSKTTDVAILKDEVIRPICKLIDKIPEKGEEVIVAGYPEEIFETKEVSITKGTVSKVLRDKDDNILIKTDAAINKGNSGGPMANACGIIGINTYTGVKLDIENLGYAISLSSIINQLPSLISEGGNISVPKADNPTTDINIPTQTRIPVLFVNQKTIYCLPEGVNFAENVTNQYNQQIAESLTKYENCLNKCSNDYGQFLDKCSAINGDVNSCSSSGRPILEKCASNCKNSVNDRQKMITENLKNSIPTLAKYCKP